MAPARQQRQRSEVSNSATVAGSLTAASADGRVHCLDIPLVNQSVSAPVTVCMKWQVHCPLRCRLPRAAGHLLSGSPGAIRGGPFSAWADGCIVSDTLCGFF